MEETKLVSLLKSLNKYEINKLKKFLASPYHNRDLVILEMYEVLIKAIKKEQIGRLTKESLWRKLMPNKKYNDVRFRKYFSDLLKLCERFIIQETIEADEHLQEQFLIKGLVKRNLSKLSNYHFKKAQKSIDHYPFRDSDFYYREYIRERQYYDATKAELNRTSIGNIEVIGTNLDYFYIAEKLKFYCSILSRKKFLTYEYQFNFIEEITEFSAKNPIKEIPIIKVYRQILFTLLEPDIPEHYFELKDILRNNSQIFPKEEANQMYQYAQNYCATKVNTGQSNFLTEYFELYQELFSKELIIEDGKLNPWHFKNVILVANRLGKYDWSENFIGEYQSYLAEAYRKNAVTYNLAQLYFYQKKYNKVIEQLRDVEYEDLAYNLNSKMILIAVYYETDELEPLYSLFDSFRTYLNRHNEISADRKTLYLNFIRFTKRISNVKPGASQQIKKIQKEVDEEKAVINKKWLLEKIEELL